MSKLQIFAIIAAVSYGVGFGTGWMVNGWRLGSEITTVKTDLNTCEQNKIVLAGAIDYQNGMIAKFKADADDRLKAAEEARKAAEAEALSLEEEIQTLSQREGETCQDAEKLINEALGL